MTGGQDLISTYKETRNCFRNAGIPSPELDARLIIADLLDLDPMDVLLERSLFVNEKKICKLLSRINARLNGKPVGRILGHREFWGLEMKLNCETFEPRPDTETLVDSILSWVNEAGLKHRGIRILDIGTGSGAILAALLNELPNAYGIGTDISQAALSQAEKNISRAGAGDRCSMVCCSFMSSLKGSFDLIVSNPPYIPSGDIELLEREVRKHDPAVALDGGEDGLDAFRALCSEGCDKLTHGGRIFVEIGYNQLHSVSNLFMDSGYGELEVVKDLSGIDRVVSASLM